MGIAGLLNPIVTDAPVALAESVSVNEMRFVIEEYVRQATPPLVKCILDLGTLLDTDSGTKGPSRVAEPMSSACWLNLNLGNESEFHRTAYRLGHLVINQSGSGVQSLP